MKKRITTVLAALLCMAGMNVRAELTQVDGVYQIGTAQDLVDFSAGVNGKTIANNVSAVLTADIDLTGINFAPIGYNSALAKPGYKDLDVINFKGNIDGQGHIISNLTVVDTLYHEAGLVSRLSGGTIKNLGIVNASITTNNPWGRAAVLAGFVEGNGHITNCFATGNIEVKANAADYDQYATDQHAGIFSAGYAIVENCYVNYSKIATQTGYSTITNSFYGDAVSEAKQKSGELAYKINQALSEPVFFQKIGEDNYPTLNANRGIVYMKGNYQCDGKTPKEGSDVVEYTNNPDDSNVDPHQFVDGICSVCGIFSPDMIVDGVYQIGTAAQLSAFARLINTQAIANTAKAALTADIDMTGINFTPIGYNSATDGPFTQLDNINFAGTIDGQGHIIKNLTVLDTEYHEAGLVSRLSGGTIKNLGIVNASITTNNPWSRTSVFAGFVDKNGTIENCFATGNIEIKYSADGQSSEDGNGGLVGSVSGCKINNCYIAYSKIIGSNWGSTITNSYYGDNASETKQNSGELAYNLNQGAGQTIYYQTLGEDQYPVLDNQRGKVQKMSAAGVATYYGTEDVTFSEDIEVYTGVVEGDVLKLTQQANTIPANTAVVLAGEEGYYNILSATGAAAITGENELKGSASKVTATGAEYALALDSNDKPAFMKVKADVAIPAGKAYLEIAEGGAVKGFAIVFGDATGLTPALSEERETTVIYDLSGRRVEKAVKGIYIVNGKKVLK